MLLKYKELFCPVRVSDECTFYSDEVHCVLRKIAVSLSFRFIVAKVDFQNFLSQLPDNLITLKDETGITTQWVLLSYTYQHSDQDSNNYYSLELQEYKPVPGYRKITPKRRVTKTK